jgi:hypothetical protein
MVAPLEPGTYRSNWKLQNSSGTLFGIGPNGDAPFWVQIIVESTPTTTPPPTLLPTPSLTVSPTPQVLVSGPAQLASGASVDLDTLQLNPGSGADLQYQADESGTHWLGPLPGARLGVYGVSQPGLQNCQNASLSTSPLPLESLQIGTYLCYQTDQGNYGWAQLAGLDTATSVVSLLILTWAQQ